MLRIRLMVPILAGALAATAAWSQQDPQNLQNTQPDEDGLPATIQAPAATGGQAEPSSPNRPAGVMPKRDSNPRPSVNAAASAASNPLNIPYLGGSVLPNPIVYALWWGDPAAFPADERDGIDDILQNGFEGSVYLTLADQYLFGQKAHISFGGNLFDRSTPPARVLSNDEIVAEVCKVLHNKGLKPDPAALYSVYPTTSTTLYPYCAEHLNGPCPDGTNIHFTFVPNSSDEPLCWVQPPELNCNQHSDGLEAAANSTAHELMESITDPNSDAWTTSDGNEIGDPCNFVYKRCVNLANETVWQLQMIWSNKVSACVQGAGSQE